MRKMRCSRQSPCLSCRMRGDECIWVGSPPGGVAEEDELKSTNDEIERLKKLVDLLLERLEEQNDAEEQQQSVQVQAQAHAHAAAAIGGDGLGAPLSTTTLAGANPYQAHFGTSASPPPPPSADCRSSLGYSGSCGLSNPLSPAVLRAALVQADAPRPPTARDGGGGGVGSQSPSDIRVYPSVEEGDAGSKERAQTEASTSGSGSGRDGQR